MVWVETKHEIAGSIPETCLPISVKTQNCLQFCFIQRTCTWLLLTIFSTQLQHTRVLSWMQELVRQLSWIQELYSILKKSTNIILGDLLHPLIESQISKSVSHFPSCPLRKIESPSFVPADIGLEPLLFRIYFGDKITLILIGW